MLHSTQQVAPHPTVLTPTSSPSSNGRPGFKEPAPIKAPLTQGRARVGPGLAPAGNDEKTAAKRPHSLERRARPAEASEAQTGRGRGPDGDRGTCAGLIYARGQGRDRDLQLEDKAPLGTL